MWYKHGVIFNSQQDIRNDNKDKSLPNFISDELILSLGYKIIVDNKPIYDETTQYLTDGGIQEINNIPTVVYIVNNKSQDDIEAERKALVPQSITKVQAMLQLKALGLWDTLKTFLSANEDANDIWVLAISVDRNNSFVPIIAQVVGWDEVQTDNFFMEAVKL